jgi:hypothetical protein
MGVAYSRYEDNLTDPTRDFEFCQLIATDLILSHNSETFTDEQARNLKYALFLETGLEPSHTRKTFYGTERGM